VNLVKRIVRDEPESVDASLRHIEMSSDPAAPAVAAAMGWKGLDWTFHPFDIY
jgi:hypothetical protein